MSIDRASGAHGEEVLATSQTFFLRPYGRGIGPQVLLPALRRGSAEAAFRRVELI
jgi:hypothetical protein